MADEKRQKSNTSKPGFSATKEGGYAAQKRYRENHPEKVQEWRTRIYEPKIRIKKEFRNVLEKLLNETGYSITELFVNAVEEKYDVLLHDPIDKKNNE